jgi:mannose-1-phosphate guanylyltransferase
VTDAVILAGGEGTRLRPLTNTAPKSLLPICNVPFLQHQIALLARHGTRGAVLLTGYLPAAFEPFSERVARERGVRLDVSREETPLGTAGAVRSVLDRLTGPTLVFNGDVLTDLDLTALMSFHAEHAAAVTIALTPVDDAGPYGLVRTAADGRVEEFLEKPPPEVGRLGGMINAGTYVIEPSTLGDVPEGEMWSFERQVFPSLLARGETVCGFPSPAYWLDIGTPARYLAAHRHALDGRIDIEMVGRRIDRVTLVDEVATVEAGASIGPYVVVGGGAVVERGAVVEGSVLLEGSRVGPGARVANSVLGPGATVESGAELRDAVVSGGERAGV